MLQESLLATLLPRELMEQCLDNFTVIYEERYTAYLLHHLG